MIWNANKEGGWDSYFYLTNNSPVFDGLAEREKDPDKMQKDITKKVRRKSEIDGKNIDVTKDFQD